MKPLRLTGLTIALAVILLDQLSKPLMRGYLAGGDVAVAPFFSLVSAWNKPIQDPMNRPSRHQVRRVPRRPPWRSARSAPARASRSVRQSKELLLSF